MPIDQFIFDFFSGGIAGVIAKTLCAPVERVKLLMQTEKMNTQIKTPYKGISDCFLRCYRDDGFISLWRGNGVNIMRYFPTQALNFSFKEHFAAYFNSKSINSGRSKGRLLLNNILAGGCAGSLTTLFVYPLDLARTRIGVDIGKIQETRQFNGLRDCLTKIHKVDGVKGLYQGLGVSLVGIFQYRGLYFGIYDTGKEVLLTNKLKNNIFAKFLFAQFVVIFSETISYPTDTLKRRMMMQSGKKKEFSNTLSLLNHIVKNEGILSLMRGNTSNIFRSIGSSLCLVLYDEIQKFKTKPLDV